MARQASGLSLDRHVHSSIEADHFNAALIGANRALRFYAGPESKSGIKEWIIEGFTEFAATQEESLSD